MKESVNKNNITVLLPLLLFVIFTTCILFVLLAGAHVYGKFTKRDQDNFEHRTAVQYITTRLRQSDLSNAVFVGNFEDGEPGTSGDTLYLREELNGRTFYTRIYCYDGCLRELFSETGLSFLPGAGQEILEISDIYFTIEDAILQIDLTYNNHSTETLKLYLRSGKEAAYEE